MKNFIILALLVTSCTLRQQGREEIDFNKDWKFSLTDVAAAKDISFQDSSWRSLDLPHDWSIEGSFDEKNPAGVGGGALPGGIGWYRKTFLVSENRKDKLFFIEFDGVYRNSEVWINGHYLGKRPNGYISFHYEITPYLYYGDQKNIISVKVDNSQQPNSRWYSGSGIYRHVRLLSTNKIHINHWGTFITTPAVSSASATVAIQTNVINTSKEDVTLTLTTVVVDANKKEVGKVETKSVIVKDSVVKFDQEINIPNPALWSIEKPALYNAVSTVVQDGKVIDTYETTFGIRHFEFNSQKGFFLNGEHVKIKGVCLHHDLGCLGAAVNKRAIERQLEIMKGMGVNGIRTSHNPPAPEFLDLCDKMGFIVMDESFDMWKKEKSKFDYHLDWNQWHKKDLEDHVLRDRNHPSVFIWSIGNEILEQWNHADSAGATIALELAGIIKNHDTTRPITAGCNDVEKGNPLIESGALDLYGFNYHNYIVDSLPITYPNKKFIATETTSALETRGYYDMPSDSIRTWPIAWDIPFTEGNPGNTISAYDNVRASWGDTHEDTWRVMKKYDHISGMFIWTGFDYLGEPTPYGWPSRSSYFGIVDLAGFKKDIYYMYESEWTQKPVLHIFPHWNWKEGQTIDIWAYSNAEEVELFLNNKSLGTKKKQGDSLHIMWRTKFVPGELRAISRTKGKTILTKEIKTSGKPAKIILEADRSTLQASVKDLSFITVKVVDNDGNVVPNADNLISFSIHGEGAIAGVDNGNQTSHESFKRNTRKAFNGLCLAVIEGKNPGKIELKASSTGLTEAVISLEVNRHK